MSLSKIPVGVGLVDGAAQGAGGVHVLAADVDVARVGLDREPADRGALDELEGRLLHELLVLEGAGLALVGVADEVVRPLLLLGQAVPLDPGREARAAAPAQARGLDLVDDRLALHPERLPQALVAAFGEVALEGAERGVTGVLEKERILGHDPLSLRPRRPACNQDGASRGTGWGTGLETRLLASRSGIPAPSRADS